MKPLPEIGRKEADPVRTARRQLKPTVLALQRALTAVSGAGHDSPIVVTASRRKQVGTAIEFSTHSPGRRQTIELLVVGEQAFLEVPASQQVVNQLHALAEEARRRTTKRVPRS